MLAIAFWLLGWPLSTAFCSFEDLTEHMSPVEIVCLAGSGLCVATLVVGLLLTLLC